jgi:hypothetical protein
MFVFRPYKIRVIQGLFYKGKMKKPLFYKGFLGTGLHYTMKNH